MNESEFPSENSWMLHLYEKDVQWIGLFIFFKSNKCLLKRQVCNKRAKQSQVREETYLKYVIVDNETRRDEKFSWAGCKRFKNQVQQVES